MRFSCIANYDFARWEEVFKDLMLTGAIVERLAHRAHIMDMSGEKAIGWKIQWNVQKIYEIYVKCLSPREKDICG